MQRLAGKGAAAVATGGGTPMAAGGGTARAGECEARIPASTAVIGAVAKAAPPSVEENLMMQLQQAQATFHEQHMRMQHLEELVHQEAAAAQSHRQQLEEHALMQIGHQIQQQQQQQQQQEARLAREEVARLEATISRMAIERDEKFQEAKRQKVQTEREEAIAVCESDLRRAIIEFIMCLFTGWTAN